MANDETTDITLFVKTSGEDIARWNRQKIVDALIRETSIDLNTAEAISREVEKQIISSGISLLTTPLIRELVDAKLIERGLEQARKMHALLGFPVYDVRELILHQNKENANVPHGPEGTNLILAEGIKKEYSLYEVFSQDVGDAHIMGDMHLHGLGSIDRPYSSFQSLEYIKKFGLNFPHSLTVAKPAKHAEVLLAHMVRFGAILQGHFSGFIGWDAVNFSFAPYLSKMNDKEIRQFAQMLIYEFSQLTSSRGGQAMFTDIHLYWDVPEHLRNVPIISPGGDFAGSTYEDFIDDARRFARAIFEVFKKGDGTGKPFIFPRPLVHISKEFFQSPGHEEFLDHICEVACEKGNTCFLFDRRGIIKAYECGFSALKEEDDLFEGTKTPWKTRCSTIQNVTLNLPRLGYKAQGEDNALFSLITEGMKLMAKAHIQKRDFIEKLLSYGDEGPLAVLAMNRDGLPYLRMDHACYLMGIVGLNELVQIHKGSQLHESEEALTFGLKVIGYMKNEAGKLGKKYGLHFILEQTPAETTAYRFARLDLKYFSPKAGHFVKGNLARGEVYYTNSSHFSVSAAVHPMERVRQEGRFHPFVRGGAVTHVWLGDMRPAGEELAEFIQNVFNDTENDQIVFSPEFTTCKVCGGTSRALKDKCEFCGSEEVEGIARITQYFSRISGWNKGKLAELKERKRCNSVI
ncbi:MAG TPA: anaerobic ribonucleoside-triphosphate reductase [Syntrophales bacterium]|nr:anaerobic ribonucleoside-triphosphate reductase [Syntrophales bacterium]